MGVPATLGQMNPPSRCDESRYLREPGGRARERTVQQHDRFAGFADDLMPGTHAGHIHVTRELRLHQSNPSAGMNATSCA